MKHQRAVIVLPLYGTACEVLDTTPDPETKIFRFKPGCALPEPLSSISVFTAPEWMPNSDPGPKLGDYRVTRKLETPPGYVAAYEGTTKPKPLPAPELRTESAGKCFLAIVAALETARVMSLEDLRRTVDAPAFPEFDACLQYLADEGTFNEREG